MADQVASGSETDGKLSKAPARPAGRKSRRDKGLKFAFWLVFAMLSALFVLLLILLLAPVFSYVDKEQLDYYKWTISVLVGAFGAWIGAGAAHFFGRENLKESSASTEQAMRIQNEALRGQTRPSRIGDMKLATLNSEFMFYPTDTKAIVVKKLQDHVDYWFVPELSDAKGKVLLDIIHSHIFGIADSITMKNCRR